MKEYYIKTSELKNYCNILKTGDKVYLSGDVYTARDAAHKRMTELLSNGSPLPFDIKNAVIYYAGPTPTPKNMPIGSCGPTTSKRMDPYTPQLFDLGLCAVIGKGERSDIVIEAIKRNHGLYLCAIGGAGALAALSIIDSQVIAFEDLGCESIKKLLFKDFPLIVAIDSSGSSIFAR